MSVALKRKIKKLRALRVQTRILEAQIRDEAFQLGQNAGDRLMMKPRLERVMELYS